jgi:hypothetical protein
MIGRLIERISLVTVITLLVGNLAVALLHRPPEARAARGIEYKVVPLGRPMTQETEALLNRHGKDGWELIQVDPSNWNLIFKK